MTPLPVQSKIPHLLTFDVEEYFHVEAAALPLSEWESWPRRLSPCVDRILALLAEFNVSATFFILGWVARHEGAVVRRIADAGHEIAAHSMTHRMLQRLTPEEFRRDLVENRKLLEDLTGRPIRGYRAPTFSITSETRWALDVLAEEGFAYDSSIFPIRHDRYGLPGAPRHVHKATGPRGGHILEIPPLTLRFAGANWPVAGGGYLRLLPVKIIAVGIKQMERQGQPAMLYLHPWELDPDQPELPLSRLARVRHRLGLTRTEAKLRQLLTQFPFTSVQSAFLP